MALFNIAIGAEWAGLLARFNESPAIMRAKLVARPELPDQLRAQVVPDCHHGIDPGAARPAGRDRARLGEFEQACVPWVPVHPPCAAGGRHRWPAACRPGGPLALRCPGPSPAPASSL